MKKKQVTGKEKTSTQDDEESLKQCMDRLGYDEEEIYQKVMKQRKKYKVLRNRMIQTNLKLFIWILKNRNKLEKDRKSLKFSEMK
jgi:hypothetical protein